MMADIPDLDPEQVESMVTMHRGMFWSILKEWRRGCAREES